MNHDEYLFLTSEINELEAILLGIPKNRVIDRRSFETRLANAKDTLSKINPAVLPKKHD